MINPYKAIRLRIRLHRIEKAIGIKLYKWQRRIALNPARPYSFPCGRANGKTIAACVWVLMFRDKPIQMRRRGSHDYSFIPDPDIYLGPRVAEFSLMELKRLHQMCTDKGIKVFDFRLY